MPDKVAPPAPKDQAGYADWAKTVLEANKHLNFVQRLFDPGAPAVRNPSQSSFSTHLMADGDGRVFPTLVEDPNLGSLYTPKDPGKYAMTSGEYIQFPDEKSAGIFANDVYKLGAPKLHTDELQNWLFLPEQRNK